MYRPASGTVEGTGASINVSCGFVPKAVRVTNVDGDAKIEWDDSMADASGYKNAGGTPGLVTTLGITPYDGADANTALTGTLAGTVATQTITGTSTAFLTELAVGEHITVEGVTYEVGAIASDTSLTLVEVLEETLSGDTGLRLEGRAEGFTIGADTDVNVDSETLQWVAWP